MTKILLPLLALVAISIVAATAQADVRGRELTLSAFIGMQTFDGTQRLGPGFAAGLRLGYNFSRHWGVESQFTYAIPKGETSAHYSQ
jgi:OOP family OmpA-OmpF porin